MDCATSQLSLKAMATAGGDNVWLLAANDAAAAEEEPVDWVGHGSDDDDQTILLGQDVPMRTVSNVDEQQPVQVARPLQQVLLTLQERPEQPVQHLAPPPLYSGNCNRGGQQEEQQQQQIHNEGYTAELPPPYTAAQPKFIRCKVCRKLIDIDNKQHLLVVRCVACNEVTPLREPPSGKRYLRCSCNCLMLISATTGRVTCARSSCRRVITINSNNGVRSAASRPGGTASTSCAHCRQCFQYDLMGKRVVRCPHCWKVSATDPAYKSRMAIVFALVAAAMLTAALAACGIAIDNGNGNWGVFCFLGGAIIVSLLAVQRSYYYCRLRVSSPSATALAA